jgi:nitrogen-specific signal transduction histidine kinase
MAVANEGEPPPPEILSHLFEPFVSGREGGHGLGLWVTYQTVKQLNGTIAVECRDGEIRFVVNLPLSREGAAETMMADAGETESKPGDTA